MRPSVLGLMILGLSGLAAVRPQATKVWTDPNDPSLPPDFKIQGEYAGTLAGGEKLGAQIIALGGGAFQAVLLPGGLPGEGWDGTNKSLLEGRLEGSKAVFKTAQGNRRYLGKSAAEFSATRKFPPDGQKEGSAETDGETLAGKLDGKAFSLRKTVRKSPTLGAKPPAGALVLFDGTHTNEFQGGRLDPNTGFLHTDGKDILTKRKFHNYLMHVEFMLPFRPDERGQGRGNSGFYQVDHYEVQVLDSFGLEGLDNECGGVYTKARPKVNMCLPPLVWQTYDVDFTNAVQGPDGKKTKNAVLTLRHNGVLVHENLEISGPTGGHRRDPEGTPGPIKLQGHGNPLQYRNLWIVEKK